MTWGAEAVDASLVNEEPEAALLTGGTVKPEDEVNSEDTVELLRRSDEGAAEEDCVVLPHSDAIRY